MLFRSGKGHQDNWVHEWRGLLRWNTNLPFRGKGQFSAILGQRKERFEARGFSPARLDGPNQNWLAAENTLRYRYYVDEPNKYGSQFLPARAPGFTYGFVQTGFASTEFKDIKYLQGVAATSFLDERVSLVLGMRRDRKRHTGVRSGRGASESLSRQDWVSWGPSWPPPTGHNRLTN